MLPTKATAAAAADRTQQLTSCHQNTIVVESKIYLC
jgi:hypothetical protein